MKPNLEVGAAGRENHLVSLKRKKGRHSSSGRDENHDETRVPQLSKGDIGQLSNSPAASVKVAAPVDSSPSTFEQTGAVNSETKMNCGYHENDLRHYIGIVA
ncbi:hypothetical protein PR048_002574 [Dryococelus australis]|uniref:Uncharacterized protein n=1 Tax=Dryococelus australis TaxID=614101 RepID=A0ABQ9IKJ7_9NEOP|nr:hypothetical protein PR048_002574 [Dryococelus australis]